LEALRKEKQERGEEVVPGEEEAYRREKKLQETEESLNRLKASVGPLLAESAERHQREASLKAEILALKGGYSKLIQERSEGSARLLLSRISRVREPRAPVVSRWARNADGAREREVSRRVSQAQIEAQVRIYKKAALAEVLGEANKREKRLRFERRFFLFQLGWALVLLEHRRLQQTALFHWRYGSMLERGNRVPRSGGDAYYRLWLELLDLQTWFHQSGHQSGRRDATLDLDIFLRVYSKYDPDASTLGIQQSFFSMGLRNGEGISELLYREWMDIMYAECSQEELHYGVAVLVATIRHMRSVQ